MGVAFTMFNAFYFWVRKMTGLGYPEVTPPLPSPPLPRRGSEKNAQPDNRAKQMCDLCSLPTDFDILRWPCFLYFLADITAIVDTDITAIVGTVASLVSSLLIMARVSWRR